MMFMMGRRYTVPELVIQGRPEDAKELAEKMVTELRSLYEKLRVDNIRDLLRKLSEHGVSSELFARFYSAYTILFCIPVGSIMSGSGIYMVYFPIVFLDKLHREHGEKVLEQYIVYTILGEDRVDRQYLEHVVKVHDEVKECVAKLLDDLVMGRYSIDKYISDLREDVKHAVQIRKVFSLALASTVFRLLQGNENVNLHN